LHVFFADVFEVSGATGGLHLGYNWPSGDIVLGPESNLDASNLKGSRSTVGAAGFLPIRASSLASVSARLGYAFDTTMPYVAGGVAVTSASEKLSLFALPTSQTKTFTGWTLGAGIEHTFTKNWIGRVEARYTDFGQAPKFLQDNAFCSGFHDASVNVGLSYKF
jgi:outer membrane immunogenic protein